MNATLVADDGTERAVPASELRGGDVGASFAVTLNAMRLAVSNRAGRTRRQPPGGPSGLGSQPSVSRV